MKIPAPIARLARGVGVVVAFLVVLVGVLPGVAAAYVPPPPQGAVTDTSGKLSAADDSVLEAHIAAYRARTTNELAVLMVGSLGGESVDDVAYAAFNTWGVGKKGTDNGVLLVIAPSERKMRIETGKGVGDRLTDIESSHILRGRVGPLLKQDRFREAILAGLEGIEAALDKNGGGVAPVAPVPKARSTPSHSGSTFLFLLPLFVLGFFGLVFISIVVLIARAVSGRGSRGGGGYGSSSWTSSDSSSSYGSSSSDWSSSSGGSSGGSDFGGSSGGSDFGGGSSGGGGSSDSY